jgi:hypothetical protein
MEIEKGREVVKGRMYSWTLVNPLPTPPPSDVASGDIPYPPPGPPFKHPT